MSMRISVHPRDEIEPQKLEPLRAGHELLSFNRGCPACDQPFEPGDVTTLLIVGPGTDPEERERRRKGYRYIARTVAAHWACVTGEE